MVWLITYMYTIKMVYCIQAENMTGKIFGDLGNESLW